MSDPDRLLFDYCTALNAELAALDCGWRASAAVVRPDAILLLDAEGKSLGWLPDCIDAEAIAAFEPILNSVLAQTRETGTRGDPKPVAR